MISDCQFGAISRTSHAMAADNSWWQSLCALEGGGLYDRLNEMGRLRDHLMTVIYHYHCLLWWPPLIVNSTSSLACKASHSTALLLSRHPPSSLFVINNGFHQSACIFPLGFLDIDHSTHSTLLSSCQLSLETSSNQFLSLNILSGQEWFLCGIQILCLYLWLIIKHSSTDFYHIFALFCRHQPCSIGWYFCRIP